jgi:hypothetical protein
LRSATGLRAKLLEKARFFGVEDETVSGRWPQSGQGLMSGPVLVDTDPGIDDALAFHYPGATGGWDLKAITVVAGHIFVATLDVQATLQ